jgi:hypothetical protein
VIPSDLEQSCDVPYAVTVDEVYALGELYKKVSNSLHQVRNMATVAAAGAQACECREVHVRCRCSKR